MSRLLNQKQQLENQRNLTYKKLNVLYSELNAQFESHYTYFKEFDDLPYEITHVDFYFGAIACEYRGDNYTLSNRLFEFNDEFSDVDVFDLTAPQLIKFYNILVILYHDVCGSEFSVVKNNRLSVNCIVDKFQTLTDAFVQRSESDQTSEELVNAIQRFYALVDFALYEDEAHADLRRLRNLYIEVQKISYDKIYEYEDLLYTINEKLEVLKEQNEITPEVNEETANMSTQQEERHYARSSMKEKFVHALGGVVFSVLGLLEFYLIYGLSFLAIGLVFWAVSYIPVISAIVEWLFSVRGDTPDMFAMMLAVALAYVCFTETAERVIKNEKTLKTTWIFTGICLAVINTIFLVANLIFHNAILVNILFAIVGIVIFFKGKNKT